MGRKAREAGAGMETDERTELENHLDVAILAQSFALQHIEFATEEEGKDLDRSLKEEL